MMVIQRSTLASHWRLGVVEYTTHIHVMMWSHPAMALYCAYILLVLNGDIVADPNFRAAGFPFAIYAPNNLRPFVCDWPQYQQKLQTTRDSTQLKKTHAHRLSYTMFVLISVQLTWAMDTNTSVLKLHLHQSQNYDHWLYTNDVDGRTDDLPTIA